MITPLSVGLCLMVGLAIYALVWMAINCQKLNEELLDKP